MAKLCFIDIDNNDGRPQRLIINAALHLPTPPSLETNRTQHVMLDSLGRSSLETFSLCGVAEILPSHEIAGTENFFASRARPVCGQIKRWRQKGGDFDDRVARVFNCLSSLAFEEMFAPLDGAARGSFPTRLGPNDTGNASHHTRAQHTHTRDRKAIRLRERDTNVTAVIMRQGSMLGHNQL